MKQSDTNYDKEIKVDNLFIAADKYEEQQEALKADIQAEQINGYFNQEIPDEMLPDWMKDKEEMYNTNPEDWTGVEDPKASLENSTMMEE